MTTTRRLTILIRLSGMGALLLGLAIWGGYLIAWIPVHMLLGATLVLVMWATAAIALRRGVRRGLAVFVVLWGLGIVVLGRVQVRLLPGGMHWVIALGHLLAGGVGMGLGITLAAALHGPAVQGGYRKPGSARAAA